MKKKLVIMGVLALLAAGCNKTAENNNTGSQNLSSQQSSQTSGEFKLISPKGGEKWQTGTTQTISWTGGGSRYATLVTLHYTINVGPAVGQPGAIALGTPTNQPGKNLDNLQWFIPEDIIKQTKGPYTVSACLVDQMPGNAFSGCKSEEVVSPAFDIIAGGLRTTN